MYSYDRNKTAGGKSYADFQKACDNAFWADVAKRLKPMHRGVEFRLAGLSVPFLIFEGFDSSDMSIDGHAALILLDRNTVKLSIDFTSAYSGKGQREHTFKSGELDTDVAAKMISEVVGR